MSSGQASAAGRTLTLSSAEVSLLGDTLRNVLDALHEEIYKTENYDLRQTLKERDESLRSILERIGEPLR
jgi:hypothetical protein